MEICDSRCIEFYVVEWIFYNNRQEEKRDGAKERKNDDELPERYL